MATIDFVQVDTSATFDVGCSGRSAGLTTAARQANSGGSAGSTPVTVDPDNNGTTLACFAFLLGKPGVASWAAGDWTIPINFSVGDAGTTLAEVHVCDYNGGTIVDVDTDTSLTGLSDATTGGTVTKTVSQGSAHTPQSTADSQPFIVIVLTNTDNHGATSVDITPNQTINSPIDDGAAGGGAPLFVHHMNQMAA